VTRLPPPEIAHEDVLRDDAIGRDLVGVDSSSRHFGCLDLTAGVVDLDVLRLMDLADDLISLDTVGVDGVGTNLRGLLGGGLAESPPDRRGRDS
jgi:hypothetical protein